MIVTVTSMKGGVGKTTIAALLAQSIVQAPGAQALIVDLDPQGGVSSILLGGRIAPPAVCDVLRMELDGMPSGELMAQATRRSRSHDRILLVPAGGDLASLGSAGPPAGLLKDALKSASLPEHTTIIVDTGTMPALVDLGLAAADVVLIPVMLSQQTGRPTINTLQLAIRHRRRVGGLVPVGIGKARWETGELERWANKLRETRALQAMGYRVLPGLPYSKALIRGRWRHGKFPSRFMPPFKAIHSLIWGEPPPRLARTRASPTAGPLHPGDGDADEKEPATILAGIGERS